jgi:hypothetical protein
MPLAGPATPRIDISIISAIMAGVNERLTYELNTAIAMDDVTKAGLVRPGLLQADPTRTKINILTYQNDPDNIGQWRHSSTESEGVSLGQNIPGYVVGTSGRMWYRRFTTKLELYFPPTVRERSAAEQLAHLILSRAEDAIENTPLEFGVDPFGEYALDIRVADSENSESGGPGRFIWHGIIRWQVLTEKFGR